MVSNIHTTTFNDTFREKNQGVQRPRMNESCLDPDLLQIDFKAASQLLDLWALEGNDESMIINYTYDQERTTNANI